MFSTVKKVIVRGGVVSATGVALYANYHIDNDEGAQRSYAFWKDVFPIYLNYRYYQLLNRDLGWMSNEEADKNYEVLHEKYSPVVKDLVYRLRGFYLKNCQLMSTQDDFVPPAYMKWVKDTQDRVPSEFQPGEAKKFCVKLLKEELNLDFDEVFESFDEEPIGVASIGQVHRAVLKHSKKAVAVKLLIPGMEDKFRVDIRTLKAFCQLAMPQHVTGFDEIEKQFCTEFDYRLEAENLSLIHNYIMPKWHDSVRIPKPYFNLCSKHVLTMEFLEGERLVDGIRRQYKKVAALSGRTLEEIEQERKEQIENGTFVFKSIAESKKERQQMERALFLKDLSNPTNISRFVYNNTLGWLYGMAAYDWTEVPVDLGQTLELLCNVHANQIFEHGAFNGDPHPGNIMLLKDGRLGLIDYGQVKKMTLKERVNYAKLILAHARGDTDEIVRIHFHELGTVTKNQDKDVAFLMSAFYNDRDTDDICHGRSLPTFIDWLEARDPMVRIPEEYIFAYRVNIMLRGMGKAFGVRFRMSKMWEQEAKQFLASQGIKY